MCRKSKAERRKDQDATSSSSPESRITGRGTDEPENHDIKDGGDAFVALDSAAVLSALRMLLQGKWVS